MLMVFIHKSLTQEYSRFNLLPTIQYHCARGSIERPVVFRPKSRQGRKRADLQEMITLFIVVVLIDFLQKHEWSKARDSLYCTGSTTRRTKRARGKKCFL